MDNRASKHYYVVVVKAARLEGVQHDHLSQVPGSLAAGATPRRQAEGRGRNAGEGGAVAAADARLSTGDKKKQRLFSWLWAPFPTAITHVHISDDLSSLPARV